MIDFGFGARLAPIEHADLPKLLAWRNDPRIWQWCRQHDLIQPEAHEAWFKRQAACPETRMYKVVDPNAQAVGVCGLTSLDRVNRRAEFSLYIGPEHQRKGLAKAALQTLLSHGFRNHGLNVIWGETFEGNPALKLFLDLGFETEGTRREFYFRDGRFIDAILVSMRATDWSRHGH